MRTGRGLRFLDELVEWLARFPWPRPLPSGTVTLVQIEEIMGNRLKLTFSFGSVPGAFAGEVKEHDLQVTVNGVTESLRLPVAQAQHAVTVDQDAAVRVEHKYVDDAGNLSPEAAVLDFIAHDTVPPPSPSSMNLTIEEVPGEEAPPVDPPADEPAPPEPTPANEGDAPADSELGGGEPTPADAPATGDAPTG